jgi:hypothetical protein
LHEDWQLLEIKDVGHRTTFLVPQRIYAGAQPSRIGVCMSRSSEYDRSKEGLNRALRETYSFTPAGMLPLRKTGCVVLLIPPIQVSDSASSSFPRRD